MVKGWLRVALYFGEEIHKEIGECVVRFECNKRLNWKKA